MKLTKEALKRIIKEEIDLLLSEDINESMKFTGGGKTLDQARNDMKQALDKPKSDDLKSGEKVSLSGILGELIQKYMNQGMDFGQAYQAAAAERPDLAGTIDEGMFDSIKSKLGFGDKEVDKDAERLDKLDHYVNNPRLIGGLGTMTRAYAAGEVMAHAEAKHPEKAEEVRRALTGYTLGRGSQENFDEGYNSYQQRFGTK